MFHLPIRTWVSNAAAVFSGEHGAVTRQAQESQCSRETVYQHARKVEKRLADEPDDVVAKLRGENQDTAHISAFLCSKPLKTPTTNAQRACFIGFSVKNRRL